MFSRPFLYVGEPFLDPGTKLVHLDNASWEVEKIYPTEVGVLADPKAGPGRVGDGFGPGHVRLCKGSGCDPLGHLGRVEIQVRSGPGAAGPGEMGKPAMPVERMMHELAQAVPEGTILADESITSRGAVMGAFDFDEPGSMYGIRGGALVGECPAPLA